MAESLSLINIDVIKTQSRENANRFKIIEDNLGITDNETRISDDIRIVGMKITNLERKNTQDRLKIQYDKLMKSLNRFDESSVTTVQEFKNATRQLLIDLNSFYTEDGESLNKYMMDGTFLGVLDALSTGAIELKENIIKQLKETLNMILSPEDVLIVIDLISAGFSDIGQFSELVMEFIQEEYLEVYTEIMQYFENSEKSGLIVEMSEYVPGKVIPLIISSIGAGKFVKLLKKLIGFGKSEKAEKILRKLENSAQREGSHRNSPSKEKSLDRDKTDLLEMKGTYGLKPDMSVAEASKRIGNFTDKLDINYLINNPARVKDMLEIVETYTQYIVSRGEYIKGSPSFGAFEHSFLEMKSHLGLIHKNPKMDKYIPMFTRLFNESLPAAQKVLLSKK